MKRSQNLIEHDTENESKLSRNNGSPSSYLISSTAFLKSISQNREFSRHSQIIWQQHDVHDDEDYYLQRNSRLMCLPEEVIVVIIATLPHADIKTLTETCKLMREIVIANFVLETLVFPMLEESLTTFSGRYILSVKMDLKTQLSHSTHDDKYLDKILSMNLKYLKRLATDYCEETEFMNIKLSQSKPVAEIVGSLFPFFHHLSFLRYLEILITDDLISTFGDDKVIFETISINLKHLHEVVLRPRMVVEELDNDGLNVMVSMILIDNTSIKILRLKDVILSGYETWEPIFIDVESTSLEVLEITDRYNGQAKLENDNPVHCPNLKRFYFSMDAEEHLNNYCLYHGVRYGYNDIAQMICKGSPNLEVYNKTDIKMLKEMYERSSDVVHEPNQWFKVLYSCDRETAGCHCPPHRCNVRRTCGPCCPEIALAEHEFLDSL